MNVTWQDSLRRSILPGLNLTGPSTLPRAWHPRLDLGWLPQFRSCPTSSGTSLGLSAEKPLGSTWLVRLIASRAENANLIRG